MNLNLFKGIRWKELNQWWEHYPEIGWEKIPENCRELNPCFHL